MPGQRARPVRGADRGNGTVRKAVTAPRSDSASTCWRRRGFDCWLLNAKHVKNVPGRPKTDKLDAVWLSRPGSCGDADGIGIPTTWHSPLTKLVPSRTRFGSP